MNLPIVVAAHNRPDALKRLLSSLQRAEYDDSVKLIISIDGGGDERVLKAAEAFQWRFGDKEIIHHSQNLGLRRHILSCGDISKEYDGIILLEDDLYVSPQFYNYARLAMDYYSGDDSIAGIALYSHSFNETARFPFYPLMDGSDVFFVQLACSWGQCWTKKQWALFRTWFDEKEKTGFSDQPVMPGDVVAWPKTSWKKHFIIYMIEKNLYFVYPRTSYTTNFGDAGQHHKGVQNFQVPLQYGRRTPFFVRRCDSFSVYDASCEMMPDCLNKMCPDLQSYDYCVDLYGTKLLPEITNEFILTSKKTRQSLMTFGKEMLPLEANIIEKIEGEKLFFSKVEDCIGIDHFIKQRNVLCNSKEEILYHYNLPESYVEQWSKKPVIPISSYFKEIKNRFRNFLK